MKNKLFLPIAIILGVLIIDQWVKYYIKTHFFLGEEIDVIGNWFKLHFTENYGMAFGMEFGGKSGKLILTLFRIVAIGFIIDYYDNHGEKKHKVDRRRNIKTRVSSGESPKRRLQYK
jgi:signal peptidase II